MSESKYDLPTVTFPKRRGSRRMRDSYRPMTTMMSTSTTANTFSHTLNAVPDFLDDGGICYDFISINLSEESTEVSWQQRNRVSATASSERTMPWLPQPLYTVLTRHVSEENGPVLPNDRIRETDTLPIKPHAIHQRVPSNTQSSPTNCCTPTRATAIDKDGPSLLSPPLMKPTKRYITSTEFE